MLMIAVCAGLIFLSSTGALAPVENIAAVPLNWISGIANRAGLAFSGNLDELQDMEALREYNAELETALARLTSEVVELREIRSDYTRIADLLNYVSTLDPETTEVVSADVIGRDTSSTLRTITLNRGTRDGVQNGMAVVTGQGLVGRIIQVSADASRVMLVNSEASAISARLQNTRTEGSVIGLAGGTIRMSMLDQDARIETGDLVITSGLGGNLPPDLVIGQVISTRQFESEIEQSAEVRSLVDFNRLEIVSVITSFEPVDLSVFEAEEEEEN
jgi:rod shape-determining protein MreC